MWFDKEAIEAAKFYVSVFGLHSKVNNITQLHNTPSGDVDVVSWSLWDYEFQAISAGPYFKINPSISFMVNFDPSQDKDAKTRIDTIWNKLIDGGTALMPLDKYPFSERYGWVKDRYGVSWQLIYTNPKGEERPLIIPSLLYVTDTCDKAEEATEFYLSIFKNAKRGAVARYPAGMEPNKEGAIMFTDFMLEGQWFAAMDGSARMHDFSFNEAISFMVHCKDQEEIDYFWKKLSADPKAEQCGWCKDKNGVSWQIVPTILEKLISDQDPKKVARVTEAFLKMKKFDIAALEKAYRS